MFSDKKSRRAERVAAKKREKKLKKKSSTDAGASSGGSSNDPIPNHEEDPLDLEKVLTDLQMMSVRAKLQEEEEAARAPGESPNGERPGVRADQLIGVLMELYHKMNL